MLSIDCGDEVEGDPEKLKLHFYKTLLMHLNAHVSSCKLI